MNLDFIDNNIRLDLINIIKEEIKKDISCGVSLIILNNKLKQKRNLDVLLNRIKFLHEKLFADENEYISVISQIVKDVIEDLLAAEGDKKINKPMITEKFSTGMANCPNCGFIFPYVSVMEMSKNYVNCPMCQTHVIKNNIMRESSENKIEDSSYKTWDKFFDIKHINEINIPLIKLDELLDNIDQADVTYKKAVSQKYKSYEQYIDLIDKKKHHFKVHDMSGDIMGTNAVTFDVLCFTDNDVDIIHKNIIKYCIGDFFNQLPETLNIFGINMNPSSYINKQALDQTFNTTISIEQAINTISMITGFYYDKKIDTFNVWTNKPK